MMPKSILDRLYRFRLRSRSKPVRDIPNLNPLARARRKITPQRDLAGGPLWRHFATVRLHFGALKVPEIDYT